LEETAQAIYKQWFIEKQGDDWGTKKLSDLCSLITDGKHGDCDDEFNSGYYFVSVKDINEGEIVYNNARQITKFDFEETHRRTNLSAGDILLTNSGTIGKMVIIKNIPETKRTTFQKSVAILKPNNGVAKTYFLYSLLKSQIKSIIDLAGGSTQSNLLLGDLREVEIKYPGFTAVCDFEEIVTHIFQMIGFKGLENQKLLTLKSLLLSKLSTIRN
jgi:type I restriction enzyme, S subunit